MDRWTDEQMDRQANWLRIMTFSITTQCHKAECRYAKYHGAFYWSLTLNCGAVIIINSRILKHLIIVRTIMAGIPYINNYFGTKAQNLPLLKNYCLFQQLRSVLSQFEKKICYRVFFYHFDPKSIFRFKSSNFFSFP